MNKKFSLFAAACLMFAAQALAEDPRFVQGANFEAQGNYEMALGEYRMILAEQPKNADAYLAAARVRVKMKDYSGALANYRLAYKFDPKMSAAYEGAAKVYELLGDKKKAEAERAKDPKNNPVEEAAEAPKAEEPVKAAEPAKPAEPTKVAESAAPAKPAEETKPEKVSEPVKVAEPVAPKAEPAAPAKVEPKPVETKPAEPAKAAEAPKTAEAAPASKAVEKPVETLPADPFERGKALFAAGKYTEAAPLWREVLKKTPGHAGAYFYAGLTRYELGEYDKAEFNLKKGLEYKEEGNDANYFLACVYQKNNKTDLEKKFLNNYLKKAAPNAKYRRKAEERLAAMNVAAKSAEAEKLSSAAEAASSESKEVAKVDSAKPATTAKEVKAVETAPEASEEVSIASAIAQYRAGNMEGALQTYKSLLETEQNPEARSFTLLQMGNVYRELRDFNSAVNRYREVVQQFPDSEWATEAERAHEDAIWLQKHSAQLPRRK